MEQVKKVYIEFEDGEKIEFNNDDINLKVEEIWGLGGDAESGPKPEIMGITLNIIYKDEVN